VRVEFLTLDEVPSLHADPDRALWGSPLIRDPGFLESAPAMPMATLSGEFLRGSLEEQAAAYLFHLVRNHPT